MIIIKFMKWIIGIIFNHTPFFHISSDSNFGSFFWDSEWRISLIALSIGVDKYYLLTWNKGKLMLYDKIELLSFLKSEDEVNQKAKSYEELIISEAFKENNDEVVLNRHQHYLNRRTDDFGSTYSNILSKINNYTAICIAYLAFLSFLTSSMLTYWNQSETSFIKIIAYISFVYAIYYFINAALFLRFSLKVKGVAKSKFSTIKNVTTDVALAKAAYIDWMSSKNRVEDNATILLNVEKYLYSSIFFSLLAWFSVSFMTSDVAKLPSELSSAINSAQVIELADCDGKVNLDNVAKVARLFEHKYIASIAYSKNNHLVGSILPFLNNFSAKNSSQIIYETAQTDSSCKSILVLVKENK